MKNSSKLLVIFALATVFSAGIGTNILFARLTAPRLDEPITAGFCFLKKNSALFVGRQFVTKAEIARTIEGAVLISPDCPDSVAVFQLLPNLSPQVDAALREFPTAGSKIRLTFEGTMMPLPLLDRFREHRELPPKWWSHSVSIEAIRSVEVHN